MPTNQDAPEWNNYRPSTTVHLPSIVRLLSPSAMSSLTGEPLVKKKKEKEKNIANPLNGWG